MDIDKLAMSDARWLGVILHCDVSKQMTLTGALFAIGLTLGLVIVAFGVNSGSTVTIAAGVAELLVAPTVCIARFHLLRLYRLIQVIVDVDQTAKS